MHAKGEINETKCLEYLMVLKELNEEILDAFVLIFQNSLGYRAVSLDWKAANLTALH